MALRKEVLPLLKRALYFIFQDSKVKDVSSNPPIQMTNNETSFFWQNFSDSHVAAESLVTSAEFFFLFFNPFFCLCFKSERL